MLKGKCVLVGITGGIAAYKICELIRMYKKNGADVKVIEEYANSDCPCVGRRLVINGKETDIVVWFADYDAWLEKKYDE